MTDLFSPRHCKRARAALVKVRAYHKELSDLISHFSPQASTWKGLVEQKCLEIESVLNKLPKLLRGKREFAGKKQALRREVDVDEADCVNIRNTVQAARARLDPSILAVVPQPPAPGFVATPIVIHLHLNTAVAPHVAPYNIPTASVIPVDSAHTAAVVRTSSHHRISTHPMTTRSSNPYPTTTTFSFTIPGELLPQASAGFTVTSSPLLNVHEANASGSAGVSMPITIPATATVLASVSGNPDAAPSHNASMLVQAGSQPAQRTRKRAAPVAPESGDRRSDGPLGSNVSQEAARDRLTALQFRTLQTSLRSREVEVIEID